MSGENHDGVGIELAKDLVTNLVQANQNLAIGRELFIEMRDLLEELCGHFNVVSCTMNKLSEQRGKKLGIADVAEAWVEAEGEVFGEDDDDDGGEEVEQPDPVSGGSGRR
jgi:hypothetical protein